MASEESLLADPFFTALADGSLDVVTPFILAGLVAALVNGTFAMVPADLFPTRVRFSGVAMSYNVSQTLFGGTSPLMAASLAESTASPTSPALVAAFAGIAFAASLGLRRYDGQVMAA